jgi:hypothetical protein
MKLGVGRWRGTVHGEERRWRFSVSNVAVAAEEISVDDGGGDRHRERWRGDHTARTLEFFWDESQTTRGGLLFVGSKISEAVLKLEPLLIVLKLISSGSSLKPLLMNILSTAVQN